MTEISPDFKELLPKTPKDQRPFSYLWSFDPDTGKVHIKKQRADHPADFPGFDKNISHPERVDGWAIAIVDGWRIFTDEMQAPDPFIKARVKDALAGKHPIRLPSVRYHGDPNR